jgi:Na+-driven multidrug efflux pump
VTVPDRSFAALSAIAFVEGLALVCYGLFDMVEAIRIGVTGPTDVSNTPALVLQIVLFLVFGAGLLWVARGWWRGRRWARAPFLLAQLIALVVGIPLAQSAGSIERWVGIALTLAAAVGLVLVFTPGVIRRLEQDSGAGESES